MKELAEPHNDWQTKSRKLDLGPYKLQAGDDPANPAHVAARLFSAAEAAPAENLAAVVRTGLRRLLVARSKRGGDGQSLQQELRSLFAPLEINLVSDLQPLRQRVEGKQNVLLPAEFFADPLLVGEQAPIKVKADVYLAALKQVQSKFAAGEKAGLIEGHHAFLVPTRSFADQRVLALLAGERRLLSDAVTKPVLLMDYTTPLFSPVRAALLPYVPDKARDAADLRAQLIENLKKAPAEHVAAKTLLTYLTDQNAFARAEQNAVAYLAACRKNAGDVETVAGWLRLAAQRRREVAAADTAKHPEGMILEPGFRNIFPTIADAPAPGTLRLDPKSGKAVPVKQRAMP
jgi:hypothetical protein